MMMVGQDHVKDWRRPAHTHTQTPNTHTPCFCSSSKHPSILPSPLPPSLPYVDCVGVEISGPFYETLQLAKAWLALWSPPGLTHAIAVGCVLRGVVSCCKACKRGGREGGRAGIHLHRSWEFGESDGPGLSQQKQAQLEG